METERGMYGASRLKLAAIGVGALAVLILLRTMVVYISRVTWAS